LVGHGAAKMSGVLAAVLCKIHIVKFDVTKMPTLRLRYPHHNK